MPKQLSAIVLAIGVAACTTAAYDKQAAEIFSAAQPDISEEVEATDQWTGRTLAFAQGACADCHAVEPPALSPNPQAPAFADIANRPGLTVDTLSTWLRDAHNYPEDMDFDLNSARVNELTDYILTLRDENYRPPTY